jgi:hypothetical protein
VKIKLVEAQNPIHLLAKVDRNGKYFRQLISAVAEGLLHYELHLGKCVKKLHVACLLKRLLTPALNILLK